MSDRDIQRLFRASHSVCAEAGHVSDAELLTRFTRDTDRAAFELLLWRHGPMVWGVCRRVLGHTQDAEDAFQVSFLTLARKAQTIGRGAAAGWLYRVALRAALAARKSRGRRAAHEQPTADAPEPPGGDDPACKACANDLGRLIDEEVARLPDKYRVPFVLCELQGRGGPAVASELGCAVGTVESRLARARRQLRARLSRRGVALPAAMAVPVVPAGLRSATLTVVATPTASLSPALARMAAQVVRPLWAGPVRTVALAAAACCAAVWAGLAGLLPPGTPPAKEPPPAANKVEPAPLTTREGALPEGALARVGATRLRHAGMVRSVAFSADGHLVATAAQDGTVRVWDAATGALRHTFSFSQTGADVPWIAFPKGGKSLVLIAPEKNQLATRVRSFDLTTGAEGAALVDAGKMQMFGVGGSPDGGFVGFTHDNAEYKLVSAATGMVVRTFRLPGQWSMRPAIAAGGRLVAFPSGFGQPATATVFDGDTGDRRPDVSDPGRELEAVEFSPDGKSLATLDREPKGGKNGLALWAVDTGKLIRRIEAVEPTASCLAFSADGTHIAVGNLQRLAVQLFDTGTGKEVRRFRSWPSVMAVAFSPDGKTLAAARSIGTVSLWDVSTGEPRAASADLAGGVSEARFLNGRELLIVSDTIAARDWRSGRVTRHFRDPRARSFDAWSISPDLRLISMTDRTGVIGLTDLRTGDSAGTLAGDKAIIIASAFSSDGRRLFTRDADGAVRIWDVPNRKLLHKIAFPGNNSGDRVAVSPDGRLLAASARTGDRSVLFLWDAASGAELRQLNVEGLHPSALAFSPDSTLLACAGGKGGLEADRGESLTPVIVWDAATGERRRKLEGHRGLVSGLAFAPDGRTLATAGDDRTVRLWELASGLERQSFKGHEGAVFRVSYSPGSRYLASVSSDAPVFVWDLYGSVGLPPPPASLSADQRQALWEGLAAADAGEAFRTIRQLLARPRAAADLLREHLKAGSVPTDEEVRRLIRDLDDNRFAVRQKAMTALARVVVDAEPAIRKALAEAGTPEARDRLKQVLGRLVQPGPERLREIRALEVLEQADTPETRQLLDELARGPELSRLKRDATQARERPRDR